MNIGLYIHIPFCRKKCNYCDFYSIGGADGVPAEYIRAVKREIASCQPFTAATVYFGGGTPSLLTPAQVGDILSAVDIAPDAEITLEANPDTLCIVSGGQGDGESITEAQCMYDRLTAMGIDPSRIWVEDRATSTWENLQYSLALIEEKTGSRPTEVAVLSSEYHLFRASLFTKAAGAEFIGIPAATSNPFLKVNYFLREVAGVWHYILLGSGGHYHA